MADVQRNGVNITGFIYTVTRWLSQRCTLIVALRPMSAAPRRYLIVEPRPFPATALAARRRYLIVVPRPMSAAPRR